jgi:hypothetical protein
VNASIRLDILKLQMDRESTGVGNETLNLLMRLELFASTINALFNHNLLPESGHVVGHQAPMFAHSSESQACCGVRVWEG